MTTQTQPRKATPAGAGRRTTARTPVPGVHVQPDSDPAVSTPPPTAPAITAAAIRAILTGPLTATLDDLGGLIRPALAPLVDSDMARSREPDGWAEDFYPCNGTYQLANGTCTHDHPGTLWADLTRAEADELHELVGTAIDTDEVAAGIAAGIAARIAAFAERHPDLPRGRFDLEAALAAASSALAALEEPAEEDLDRDQVIESGDQVLEDLAPSARDAERTVADPTAEQVRALLERRTELYPEDNELVSLEEAAVHVFDLIDWFPPSEEDPALGDDVFCDLRPSEETGLKAIITEHRDRAQGRALEILREECVAAALRFASEFPEARRAQQVAAA